MQNLELVDLGLPSGNLWMKCNLGAESETKFGLFYDWGNIIGHDGLHYDWANIKRPAGLFKDSYKMNKDSYAGTSGANYIGKTLDPAHDAVYQVTNGKCHIPTKEEFQELIKFTKNEWVDNFKEMIGLSGRVFTGSNGNKMFIPAAGYCYDGLFNFYGLRSYMWTSERSDNDKAIMMHFYSYKTSTISEIYKHYGFSLRGVKNT